MKSAREFFERLTTANVKRVVDIRLHKTSQLARGKARNRAVGE